MKYLLSILGLLTCYLSSATSEPFQVMLEPQQNFVILGVNHSQAKAVVLEEGKQAKLWIINLGDKSKKEIKVNGEELKKFVDYRFERGHCENTDWLYSYELRRSEFYIVNLSEGKMTSFEVQNSWAYSQRVSMLEVSEKCQFIFWRTHKEGRGLTATRVSLLGEEIKEYIFNNDIKQSFHVAYLTPPSYFKVSLKTKKDIVESGVLELFDLVSEKPIWKTPLPKTRYKGCFELPPALLEGGVEGNELALYSCGDFSDEHAKAELFILDMKDGKLLRTGQGNREHLSVPLFGTFLGVREKDAIRAVAITLNDNGEQNLQVWNDKKRSFEISHKQTGIKLLLPLRKSLSKDKSKVLLLSSFQLSVMGLEDGKFLHKKELCQKPPAQKWDPGNYFTSHADIAGDSGLFAHNCSTVSENPKITSSVWKLNEL